MIKPVLILSFCYSRPAFRGKLFLVEVGFAARRPYCSIFKLFSPLDIQTCRAARYSTSVHWIFKLFRLLDIQTLRAARYSKFSGWSIFKLFRLVDIQTFRAARYLKFSGCSVFSVFGALDIQNFRAARYSRHRAGCLVIC